MWCRTNKDINLKIELRRRKTRTNSGCIKHNFDDTERISKILELTLPQSLATPDNSKKWQIIEASNSTKG